MAHGHGHDEPLLSAYHFNYSQRPPRDRAWGLAYSLLVLLTVGWAAALVVLNPDIVSVLSCPNYLDDANNCPLKLSDSTTVDAAAVGGAVASVGHDRGSGGRLTLWMAQAREAIAPATRRAAYQHLLLSEDNNAAGDSSTTASSTRTISSLRHLLGGAAAAAVAATAKPQDDSALPRVLLDYGGLLLLLSLAAALVLTALFVAALRISPWALVLLACALQVGAPLASAMLAMQSGNHSLALVLLLVSAAVAVMLYVGREALALVSRLLGVSAVALSHNSVLLALVAGLKAALAGATVLMLVAAAVVGASGDVVPNPLRGGSPRCATPSGMAVACCALSAPASLHAYAPASAIALAWTVLLLFELKVFVVSGVVAQWYFSPTSHLPGAAGIESGAALRSGSAGGWWSGRALCASLGHALGPSFGSLCAASAILGSTAYARAVVNRILYRGRGDGYGQFAPPGCCGINCLLAAAAAALGCCCWCAVALLEQISKFATVQMAMSGLGFWRASAAVVDLLRRNFMDAYNMWWYLPLILHSGGAAFAAAWGYAIYFLASNSWAWPAFMTGHLPPLTHAAAAALGGLAGGVAALVLVFVCSVLVNIADALFICFVLDKDSSAVTWYELHRVCAQLPCCVVAATMAADPHAAHHHTGSPYFYPSASPAMHTTAPYGYQGVPVAPGIGGQLGQPINPYGTRYGSYGPVRQPQPAGAHYGGFWGWLRSPSGSAGGYLYGVPVGRAERPQYPPPAVLSPPYSYTSPPVAPPLPAQPYFPPMGSPHRPA
ncbi:hypothetical protein HYH02_007145 [Chlamydomonas schloesseri]|uniref:Choline transporter-like protein n=1 Tax=Chlamydomonas schloesseri TaxID=2026947 RepID=A0A835WHR3_9CHLO|nr:hypothetical protein HYH02_007145 [Chlamydomonas schloesseri]|eukprot:KAG2447685.1 hypothetical protein HYH02_007145 [Chlamydomonas schloesseri]